MFILVNTNFIWTRNEIELPILFLKASNNGIIVLVFLFNALIMDIEYYPPCMITAIFVLQFCLLQE